MKNYFLLTNILTFLKERIFIFFLLIIFLFFPLNKSFGEENIFTINNVEIKGEVDINFSREKYLNKAFVNSYKVLMNKILLTSDLQKTSNIKLKEIKKLISSFQIKEEKYYKNEYKIILKINFNKNKVKKLLSEKNISYSEAKNISAIFFPVLYINDEFQDFDTNYFYQNWLDIKIEHELINFILPLDDLEDFSKISEIRENIKELEVDNLVNKYDVKNYTFSLMSYKNKKLNVHLKINFNNNIINKNLSYSLDNFKDKEKLNSIIKKLKVQITDFWKAENHINLLMPLSIQFKFNHSNLKELNRFRNIIYQINLIESYSLEEFNVKESSFKIYYYGNPKKLRSELLNLGYQLINEKGHWQLYINE